MRLQRALHINLDSGYYRIERIETNDILGPVDFGFREAGRNNALCFGGGAFMGSAIPGSNRLIFTGFSPCWGGFYVSTMGGAALAFDNLGVDYVALEGRARTPTVLRLLRSESEEVRVDLITVPLAEIWAQGGEGHNGFYALMRYQFERFAKDFPQPPRILAVGQAALHTDIGAIGSIPIERGRLSGVDTWAGRGGLGSKLLQQHGVCGIVYGGSELVADFDDRRVVNEYFEKRYHMRLSLRDRDATTKYRYDEKLKTGGTFGVNYAKMGDKLLAFNYRSVHWPKAKREEVLKRLVHGHYLKQFNEETIDTRSFRHCGEPCPAVCKKMREEYKKDYEPYQTMGPLCGIFDQRAAERLCRAADAAGFDGIQIGGVLSWLMDLLDTGKLTPERLGLKGEASQLKPRFDPDGFDVVQDSARNAELGVKLLERVLDPNAQPTFLVGAREVAKKLGHFEDPAFIDRLIANGFGSRGWMVPNQYWVPGMLSPMPVMGKYYEYYGDDFLPPRDLGRINAERMVQELILDNLGFCRFHREWAEELGGQLVAEHFQLDTDVRAHHLNLAKRINSRNASAFWEGEGMVELLQTYLLRKRESGEKRPELGAWLDRFEAGRWDAARDFWYEIRKGVDELLGDRPAPRTTVSD